VSFFLKKSTIPKEKTDSSGFLLSSTAAIFESKRSLIIGAGLSLAQTFKLQIRITKRIKVFDPVCHTLVFLLLVTILGVFSYILQRNLITSRHGKGLISLIIITRASYNDLIIQSQQETFHPLLKLN
jgi:hypothetical protein